MQTRWVRTNRPRWCCQALHPRGTPMLAIAVAGVTRVLWRCPRCAGEVPPPDLPPPAPVPWAVARRLRLAQAAFDWKARQAGGREPGEEG